ncbi:MAG: EAL domain-containing protein [Frankiaceae bacterium]|nr:EAL domain-containing protein [Frankiaceae bacterium]
MGRRPPTPLRSGASADDLALSASAWTDIAFRRGVTAMAVTDADGRVLEANQALCSLLAGFSTAGGATTAASHAFTADLAERIRAVEEGSSSHLRTVVFERDMPSPAGENRRVCITATVVREKDGTAARALVQFESPCGAESRSWPLAGFATDRLTGLVGRSTFYAELESTLLHPRRARRRLAVLVVNLNRFQQVNAGLGQVAADVVLMQVAGRLRLVMDPLGGTVCRLGGDWFAVIATGVVSWVDAVALAVRIHKALAEPYWASGNPVFVPARIGIATAPSDATDAATLVRKATVATNLAKKHSSGWALPVAGSDLASRDEIGLVSELQTAIEGGQLTVAYQPIVDGDGRVHSLEALARWQHPTRGAVAPDQFIVLAEQYGLIGPLTRLMLAGAVQQAVQWASVARSPAISVNLSGRLLSDPRLRDSIAETLAAAGLPASALTLEITESALADGADTTVREALEALRATGIHISIDDFGTGYSSLAYLKELPVDELKIDRSFIVDLVNDDRAERVVRSIIDLAHSLDLSVVAEGVEDAQSAERLLRLGVDFLQGFGIARPAGGEATTEWLAEREPSLATARGRVEGGRRLNVLIVDDEMAARAALRARLADRHHRVIEARSGPAAVDKVRKRMPDVVILDHLMPGLTGVDTVPRLREAGYLGPILLYSDAPADDLAGIRMPLDVWPVSKADEATFVKLIDGYARAAAAAKSP